MLHHVVLGVALFATAATQSIAQLEQAIDLGLRGVYFVENQGQWSDAAVHFGLRTKSVNIAFSESSLQMHIRGNRRNDDQSAMEASSVVDSANLTLTVSFPGSNPVLPVGAEPRAAKFNYFIGDDESTWQSHVPSFGSIVYEDLYDGIDLHIMGNDDGVLKYEFHCDPGAKYSQIQIAYDGIESLCIDHAGGLQIATRLGTLRDAEPIAWQPADELRDGLAMITERTDVAARFELIDNASYRIAVDGEVDHRRSLVIDPDVQWMRYVGGSQEDEANAVTVDGRGCVLITGRTRSMGFVGRLQNHYRDDVFLAKIDSHGNLVWMTILGGSWEDVAHAIVVNRAGTTFLGGATYSRDFPGQTNTYRGRGDIFVAAVDGDGQIEWMTFLGGFGNDRASNLYGPAFDLARDEEGNLYVTGSTDSEDFLFRTNELHGRYDAFLAKVRSNGEIEWVTFLGGTFFDNGRGLMLANDRSIIVTGDTDSSQFEGRRNPYRGGIDAFFAQVDQSGTLMQMRYVGGAGDDHAYAITGNEDGEFFLSGSTKSRDFERRKNERTSHRDAFIAALNSDGFVLWSLYLGNGRGTDIVMDGSNDLLVAGYGVGFFEGQINEGHGGADAFALLLDTDSFIQRMIHLGGSETDLGYGIAVDNVKNVYVVGTTFSTDFEGRINEFHRGSIIKEEGFVARIRLAESLDLAVDALCRPGGPARVSWAGATPHGVVALLFATMKGAHTIPSNKPCSGTMIGLSNDGLRLLAIPRSSATGSGNATGTIRASACGSYLQLIDLSTCATSNVARIE